MGQVERRMERVEKRLVQDLKQYDSPFLLKLVGDSYASKQGVVDSQMENK